MRGLGRALGGALAAIVVTAMFPAVTALGADSQCWTYKDSERRFTRLVNRVRTNKDRVRLRLDPEISKVARAHSRRMLEKDWLHHSTTLSTRVTNWTILGENVGVGGTVRGLHKAFMNSSAHKDNIIFRKYRHVGVGVVKNDDGTIWVTVVFEARENPGTTLSMPSC